MQQNRGQAADQNEDLMNLLGAMGIAVVGIFVMLASFTRSYILPLVILTTVAYGVVGAVVGHVLLGYPLTFISLFGIVALSGVVVNDTILLLDDYTRRLSRLPDLDKMQAMADSAVRRFRPILMTTLSTAFGLLPMIYETSLQAKFLIPMTISLGFGILLATPILLVSVPATVLILNDLAAPFRWGRRRLDARRDTLVDTHTCILHQVLLHQERPAPWFRMGSRHIGPHSRCCQNNALKHRQSNEPIASKRP